jgi:hypothetical protein
MMLGVREPGTAGPEFAKGPSRSKHGEIRGGFSFCQTHLLVCEQNSAMAEPCLLPQTQVVAQNSDLLYPRGMAKRFRAGDEFKIAIPGLDVGAAEHLEAEFGGPSGNATLRFVILMAQRSAGFRSDLCVLEGHIPRAATPGSYRLTRLATLQDNPESARDGEWSDADLPDVSFEVAPPDWNPD